MYSLPSRSQRRHPRARRIAIGYGSKYFTFAVTPPGRDRRARSEYAFEDFVRARAAVRLAFTLAMRSSRHRSPLEILFAGSARDFKWEGAVRRWCPSSRDPQRPG